MAYIFAQIINDEDPDFMELKTVDSLVVDGYSFGDRALEGVDFILTLKDGELTAHMDIDEKLRKSMRLNREECEADAVQAALGTDILNTVDGFDALLFDTTKKASEHPFYLPDSCKMVLDDKPFTLPQ